MSEDSARHLRVAGSPLVLVVGGRDPTGGAGVDADREALERHGARGAFVVTARTDQDGVRVRSIGAREPHAWAAEARAALAAERPSVIKSGLLPGAEHVGALAELLRASGVRAVVDPCLAASGGERFLDDAGRARLLDELVPLGVVLTPNLPEACALAGLEPDALDADLDRRVALARELVARGAGAVLLKGGHGSEDPVHDLVLERGAAPRWHRHPRALGRRIHGSGCRYASAVAAGLARGLTLEAAAAAAGEYVRRLVAGV